jgi:hypothetical protein
MIPKKSVLVFGAIALVSVGLLASFARSTPIANNSTALTKIYSNAAYGFILKMPDDFSAYPPHGSPARDENGMPTGEAVVLQNSTGAAVQIVITPDGRPSASNVLTVEDVEQLAPYLDLSDAMPIQIAPGITGLRFTDSEHPAYGTSTDEVWFAYRGNLYQVIADAKFDDLFKLMMSTWSFI